MQVSTILGIILQLFSMLSVYKNNHISPLLYWMFSMSTFYNATKFSAVVFASYVVFLQHPEIIEDLVSSTLGEICQG